MYTVARAVAVPLQMPTQGQVGVLAKLLIASIVSLSAAWLPADGLALEPTAAPTDQTDLPKLQVLRELTGRGSAFGMAWSSDGSKIAAYGSTAPGSGPFGNLITIWDPETGDQLRELYRPGGDWYTTLSSLAFINHDKQILAPGSPSIPTAAFSIFDISGEAVRNVDGLHPDQPAWNINSPASFAVSPDGSLVAVVPGRALAQPIALYSTENWQPVATLTQVQGASEHSEHVVFSADGRFFAFDHGTEVWVCDVQSLSIIQKIKPFPEMLAVTEALGISPDGSMIAAATGWTGLVPNPDHNGSLFLSVPMPEPVRVYRVSDSQQVAGVNVYRKPSEREPNEQIFALTWSPDGRFIVFADTLDRLHLWDPLHPVQGVRTTELRDNGAALGFSPDGKRLAVDYAHGPVTIFDVAQ